jgi:hypothetical protein
MFKYVPLALLIAMLTMGQVIAQDVGFGLGIIAGEPTGISGKYWSDNTTAVDAAVAWSFEKKGFFQIHADYLYHSFDLIKVKSGNLPVYYGVGGSFKLNSDDELAVRIPVGLNYHFPNAPVDIFVEIVPMLDLVPDSDFGMNGAVGIRYFF